MSLSAPEPVRRWLSSLLAISVNAILQAVGLIIFARTLGPVEYSIIVATSAVGMLAAEFVGLGSGDLLIREVSRNPEAFRAAFGRALKLVALTLPPIALAAAAVAQFWFKPPATFGVILALVASEIIATRIVFLTEQSAIAHHQTGAANANRIVATALRFGTVCFAVLVAGIGSAAEWVTYAAVMALLSAGITLAMTGMKFGWPVFTSPVRTELHIGAQFSLMQIIRAVQFSVDKFAVGWVGSAASVGSFGLASRVAQLGMLPAVAVTRITYPMFFETGSRGTLAALRLALRILPVVLGIGIVASLGVALSAYLVPGLFGADFAGASPFILILAGLPLAAGLQNLAGDALSGSDQQMQRIKAGGVALLLLCLAVFIGATSAGVVGAVIGYIVGQVLFTAVLWSAVLASGGRARSRISGPDHA